MNTSSTLHLLVLEIIPDDPLRHYRAEHFPFLAGICELVGIPVEWIGLGVPLDMTFDYCLSPEDEAIVGARVSAAAPTHVVTNEHLVADQWARLQAAAPETTFLFRGFYTLDGLLRFLIDTLGVPDLPPALTGEDWLAQVTPRYRRVPANAFARTLSPVVQVVAGPRCTYTRSLTENPFYRDRGIPDTHGGCTFCGREWRPYRVGSFLDFAVRQVVQADADLADQPLVFDIQSAAVWDRLEAFFDRIAAAGVRPLRVYVSPRLDEILAAAGTIDRLLPRLAARGDGLAFYSSGVENFSDVENQRLNKGLDAATIDAATALIVAWREAFPDTFSFPPDQEGLSTILFTPWTTLADVRTNLERYASNPLIAARACLGSRLLLYHGRPVTDLAAADGVLVEDFDDHAGEAGCKIEWDQRELPWRFLHPEVALLARFARRVSELGGIAADDPERILLEAWQETIPTEERDPLGLCVHALAALEEAPDLSDLRSLAAAIQRRIDPAALFRWPGDSTWVRLDEALRSRVAAAFARVQAERPALLHGTAYQSVELRGADGADALRVSFLGPGATPFRVWIQDAALQPKAFKVYPPVAVWVDRDTPLVAAWMEAVVDLAARVAARLASERFMA